MVKTSVYLDEEQKRDLEQVVAITGRSQADLVRDGIGQVIQDHPAKRPYRHVAPPTGHPCCRILPYDLDQ